MKLTAGNRLVSTVCSTEIIVVKAGDEDVSLTCGGIAMVLPEERQGATTDGTISDEAKNGTLLGKRYINVDDTLELLCTKAGEGSLGIGDTLLEEKEAKVLPASD